MKYITIEPYTINNGPGIRTSLYIAGCTHNCTGCFNKIYQDYNIGHDFIPIDVMKEISDIIYKRPVVAGLSILGGSPLDQTDEDLSLLYRFITMYKEQFPDKSIWLYTGFKFEDVMTNLLRKQIITSCDVLVDGKFIKKLADPTLAFRGSSNQRIIDIKNTLINKQINILNL